ncbi:MAG: MFS transporter, partial [Cyanobacteria bacterium J06598_3]
LSAFATCDISLPRVFRSIFTPMKTTPVRSLFHPDFPFSPAKFPFFYGWVILVASVLGVMTSIPGQTIGVSVFTDHLIEATGLSRLQLSNAYLAGTLTSGCLLPFGGKLLDRIGARRIVVLAAMGLGLTLCYLANCDRIAFFLSQQIPFEAKPIAAVILVLGFVSLRFCGQGMLTMTSRTTLGKWFEVRRGQVSGIEGIFVAFGFAIAPYWFSQGIAAVGWRQTWLGLAAVVGLGMSTIGWLLFRDNPELCGLRMDGARAEKAEAYAPTDSTAATLADSEPQPPADVLWGLTRGEAIKTLAFWAVTLAFASQALAMTGMTFHIVSIGAESGLSEPEIVGIFVPNAVVSTAVGFTVGLLCDRIRLQYIFMFMMAFQSMGIAAMANLNIPGAFALAVLGWGVSTGCFATLTTVTLPRFFGRAHLGAIAGVQMMIIVIGSAVGPSLLANVKAVTGSYNGGLYLCCCFAPVVILLMALILKGDKGSGYHHPKQ